MPSCFGTPEKAPQKELIVFEQPDLVTAAQALVDQDKFNNYDSLQDDTDELAGLRQHNNAMSILADITNQQQQDSEVNHGMRRLVDKRLQVRQTSNQLVVAGNKAAGLGQENKPQLDGGNTIYTEY